MKSLAVPQEVKYYRDFPGSRVVKILLPLLGARVPPLARELRSHMLCSAAKKKKKKKKVNIELPYDPAIPLISICPKELKTGTHTNPYTRVFTAASLTIAKRWKQPKCPSADDAINKLWKIIPP